MEKYYLKWPITKECPLNCKFCNNKLQRPNWSNELSEQEAFEFTEYINSNDKISGITITGGEPLVSKHFINVCENLKKPFGFITSGYNIENRMYAPVFDNPKLSFITISIDCLKPGVVGDIRGKDILKEQLNALEYLLSVRRKTNKFKIFVNTVVSKVNAEYLIELIGYLSDKGIDRIQLFKCSPSGNEKFDQELRLTHDEEIEISKRIINYYIENKEKWKKNNFKLLIRFIPGFAAQFWEKKSNCELPISPGVCGIPRNTLYLKTDTRINLCKIYKSELWENIRSIKITDIEFEYLEENVLSIGKSKLYDYEHYDKFKPCSSCSRLKKTCYPCVNLNPDGRRQVEIGDCIDYIDIDLN